MKLLLVVAVALCLIHLHQSEAKTTAKDCNDVGGTCIKSNDCSDEINQATCPGNKVCCKGQKGGRVRAGKKHNGNKKQHLKNIGKISGKKSKGIKKKKGEKDIKKQLDGRKPGKKSKENKMRKGKKVSKKQMHGKKSGNKSNGSKREKNMSSKRTNNKNNNDELIVSKKTQQNNNKITEKKNEEKRKCKKTTKKCEKIGGKCINKGKCTTKVVQNKCLGFSCECCIEECSEKKKCVKKNGKCKTKCSKKEMEIRNGCKGKTCKCCAPQCEKNKKCANGQGTCVAKKKDCKGKAMKDKTCGPKNAKCFCCVIITTTTTTTSTTTTPTTTTTTPITTTTTTTPTTTTTTTPTTTTTTTPTTTTTTPTTTTTTTTTPTTTTTTTPTTTTTTTPTTTTTTPITTTTTTTPTTTTTTTPTTTTTTTPTTTTTTTGPTIIVLEEERLFLIELRKELRIAESILQLVSTVLSGLNAAVSRKGRRIKRDIEILTNLEDVLNKLEIAIDSRNKTAIISLVSELTPLNTEVLKIKSNLLNISADELLKIKTILVTLTNKPLIMIGKLEKKINEITNEIEQIEDEELKIMTASELQAKKEELLAINILITNSKAPLETTKVVLTTLETNSAATVGKPGVPADGTSLEDLDTHLNTIKNAIADRDTNLIISSIKELPAKDTNVSNIIPTTISDADKKKVTELKTKTLLMINNLEVSKLEVTQTIEQIDNLLLGKKSADELQKEKEKLLELITIIDKIHPDLEDTEAQLTSLNAAVNVRKRRSIAWKIITDPILRALQDLLKEIEAAISDSNANWNLLEENLVAKNKKVKEYAASNIPILAKNTIRLEVVYIIGKPTELIMLLMQKKTEVTNKINLIKEILKNKP